MLNKNHDLDAMLINSYLLFVPICLIVISPPIFSFGSALGQAPNVPTNDSRPIGIDVSDNDGTINWTKVATTQIDSHSPNSTGVQPIKFAFIRASDGKSYNDTEFSNNWQGINSTNIIHGAYHFFRAGPTASDGKSQAVHFLSILNSQNPPAYSNGFLPPIVDYEFDKPMSAHLKNLTLANLTIFLNYVHNVTGRTPIIYTSYEPWSKLTNSTVFSKYPLWFKVYPEGTTCQPGAEQVKAGDPSKGCRYTFDQKHQLYTNPTDCHSIYCTIPQPWGPNSWTFWQERGELPHNYVTGIPNGNPGFDIFNGNNSALSSIAASNATSLASTPSSTPSSSAETKCDPNSPLLITGSPLKSKVKELQQDLKQLGYDIGRGGVDGLFGKDTATTVSKFQQDKGLVVDGKVGKDTWPAICTSLRSSANATAPSANATAPSANATAPSANATAPSANATAPSANATAPSANATASPPSNSTALATNSTASIPNSTTSNSTQ
jgi:GH25 family lysozyme M1 (1,4-beta-N-acetylmuramidase)/peptidoglycan hydrolase-like protein with peptidoglycan-binding domain